MEDFINFCPHPEETAITHLIVIYIHNIGGYEKLSIKSFDDNVIMFSHNSNMINVKEPFHIFLLQIIIHFY